MIHINLLVNAIILIFILHLLIVQFDKQYERYSEEEPIMKEKSKREKSKRNKNKIESFESLDYLEEDDTFQNTFENTFQNTFENTFQNTFENTFENKNKSPSKVKCDTQVERNMQNTITPANTFDSMDYLNTPNFESNVLDFNQFYTINRNRDREPVRKNNIQQVSTPTNSLSLSPRSLSSADTGKIASRPSRQLPDRWEYANDLPMNGGMFGSIVGLDSSESLYSPYEGGAVSMKKCAQEVIARVPHNDLRKPIIYN